jgi:hypothetical protein
MTIYRAYNVDSLGKTLGFKTFEADSDIDAWMCVAALRQKDVWTVIDVWQNNRKLELPL